MVSVEQNILTCRAGTLCLTFLHKECWCYVGPVPLFTHNEAHTTKHSSNKQVKMLLLSKSVEAYCTAELQASDSRRHRD